MTARLAVLAKRSRYFTELDFYGNLILFTLPDSHSLSIYSIHSCVRNYSFVVSSATADLTAIPGLCAHYIPVSGFFIIQSLHFANGNCFNNAKVIKLISS
jgi:hypothetical protein